MEQVLLHMSAAQNHRGKETPNSWVSSFIDARVGLMHNRMKTIDMAVAPKQPFEDNDTGLVVMLDGEIFSIPPIFLVFISQTGFTNPMEQLTQRSRAIKILRSNLYLIFLFEHHSQRNHRYGRGS